MLRQLRVQNLMSLKDVTIELDSHMIFVGPNGSGKSAILKALQIFSRLMHRPLRWPNKAPFNYDGVYFDELVWQGDLRLPVVFQAWFEGEKNGPPNYEVEIRRVRDQWGVTHEVLRMRSFDFELGANPLAFETQYEGTKTYRVPLYGTSAFVLRKYDDDPKAAPFAAPFADLRRKVGFFSRWVSSARDIARPVNIAKQPRNITSTGAGTISVLRSMASGSRKDEERFSAIKERIREWFPHIESIHFEDRGPLLVMKFSRTGGSVVRAELESDGVILSLFLLMCAYRAGVMDTLAFEGPEEGIHPYLLGQRYQFLRQVLTGKATGTPVRTILTTHSIDFLNAIPQDEATDVLRVVEFSPDSGPQIHRLRDEAEVDKLRNVYGGKLGDLWWSGAIGGVPSR